MYTCLHSLYINIHVYRQKASMMNQTKQMTTQWPLTASFSFARANTLIYKRLSRTPCSPVVHLRILGTETGWSLWSPTASRHRDIRCPADMGVEWARRFASLGHLFHCPSVALCSASWPVQTQLTRQAVLWRRASPFVPRRVLCLHICSPSQPTAIWISDFDMIICRPFNLSNYLLSAVMSPNSFDLWLTNLIWFPVMFSLGRKYSQKTGGLTPYQWF